MILAFLKPMGLEAHGLSQLLGCIYSPKKVHCLEIRNLPANSHSQFPGPEMDQSMELGSISNLAVKLLLLAGRHWSVTSHKPSAVHLDTSGRAPRIRC